MIHENVPPHVRSDLVFDFDFKTSTTGISSPYEPLLALEKAGAPPLFYTRANGGHWVARTYGLVSELLRDHQRFGTYPSFIPPNASQPALIPIQIDPPDHTRYRKILAPLFSPSASNRLEEEVRRTAVRLIEPISKRNSCDFVTEYAQVFPQYVFLGLMGMPISNVKEFVGWTKDFLAGEPAEKAAAAKLLSDYIASFVDEKMKNPGEDWAGYLIKTPANDDGPALTRGEIVNISYFLFLAGLDTTTNAHAHCWRHFADHPDVQTMLRADPRKIPAAMEELLRLHAIINSSRKVREDMLFHGVKLKGGEAILLLISPANRDGIQFEDANSAQFDRQVNRHLTFGAGIHRCLGSSLARTELRISLEEWQKRIPEFKIADETAIRSIGGVTMGLDSLPLTW